MKYWTCLLFMWLSVAASQHDDRKWLKVNTKLGPVRGKIDSSGELWTFLNVPYATAPTGKNKFKAPLPPPTWKDPFDAVDRGIICPQADFKPLIPEYLVAQEDCLVANIYVPRNAKKNLSVYVVVHGGSFLMGYGDWLKTTNLLKYKDLIVVTFNYRLGLHGFLCLGTDDVPGNAGMKDQVALLKWVKQNIAAFGGNPNDVTVGGYSAGSASVDLLTLSKSAEGLFHKVILESGANLATYSCQSDPLQNAKNHAKSLNFTNVDDISDLEKFFKTLPYDILVGDFKFDTPLTFIPCIERNKDGAFLTKSPLRLLRDSEFKKLPTLYGFNNMEGLAQTDHFDDVRKVRMNKKFSDFLPNNLKFKTADEKEKVAKEVKEFYFGDKQVDKDTVLSYVDFTTDTWFIHPSLWAVKLYVKAGHDQVYLYEYSFTDEQTVPIIHTNVRGATHCAQTFAVSDGRNFTHINENNITKEYRNMKKVMREIWHNFVKTGKPVPEGSTLPKWSRVGAEGKPYMSLGQKLELRDALIAGERVKLWDAIYSKYYKEPIPPNLKKYGRT